MTLSQSDHSPGARVVALPTRARGDAALVQAAALGDVRAARLLWDRHAPALRCSLRHLLGPGVPVEEPLHRVFLRLLTRMDRLSDPGHLRVFLLGTALEVVTPKLRRARLARWFRRTRAQGALARHYALLAALGTAERIAFVLRYLEGLQPAEIGQAMQLQVTSVNGHLARATRKLSAAIRRSEGSSEDDRVLLARFQDLALGDLDGDASELESGAGRERLAQSLQRAESRGHRRRWLWSLAALAAAAGAAGTAHRLLSSRPPLTYVTAEGPVGAGGYVRGAPGSGSRIQFSDGSTVELSDGARGRISAVHRDGARIALEGGQAWVTVAASPQASWALDAGPFVLELRGTRALIEWSAADEVLEVGLHEGSATVSGPPAPSGLQLLAGQRLVAAEGKLQVEPL